MRVSPKRHVVALLRIHLGFGQREFAEMVGCSRELIQSVELARAPLTDALAWKIQLATGVSLAWLLRNDLDASLVAWNGKPYTKHEFESWRASNQTPVSALIQAQAPSLLFGYYDLMRRALTDADTQKAELILYRLSEFFAVFLDEFTTLKVHTVPSYTKETLDLVEKDLKASKRLQRFLRGKVGHVSNLPDVAAIAADIKRNLEEAGKPPFVPQDEKLHHGPPALT